MTGRPALSVPAIQNIPIRTESRKLSVRWTGNTANVQVIRRRAPVLVRNVPSCIVADTRLVVVLRARVHRPPGIVLTETELVLDEVTRYLSWEHVRYEKRLVEETERAMMGEDYVLGVDWARGNKDYTAFVESTWQRLATAMKFPLEYLQGRPPAGASLTLDEKKE